MVEGGPVYLRDVGTNEIRRLAFFTTRWVDAETEEMASEKAWQHVLAELAETGNCNPPEQPVAPVAMQSVKLTWLEGLLHKSSGKGFTFYPHDAHEAV